MLKALLAAGVILLVLLGWIGVQHVARSFAAGPQSPRHCAPSGRSPVGYG